jgi:hypothetical protein
VVLLRGSESGQVFFYRLFIYVLPLEIQLSKGGEDYDPINWHNPATCLCLFQTRTWIFNDIYRDLLFYLFNELCLGKR